MTGPRLSRLLDWQGHRYLAWIVRLYLGWLFLMACWHKIAHPEAFALDVATYQLLPRSLIHAFAIYVPWLELLVGVCLVVGYRVRAAASLVVLLMASFIIALVWALHLGLDMSCGCFASQAAAGEDSISWRTLVRDLSWLALASYVATLDKKPLGISSWFPRKAES